MADQTSSTPDLLKLATDWVIAHFGLAGIIAVGFVSTAGIIWWNWAKIIKLPGVAWLLALIFPEKESPPTPLPRPKPDRLAVAVVHLEGDQNGELERLIIEGLSEMDEIQVIRFDRVIAPTDASVDDAIQAGHRRARDLLAESGAHVLIWGTVLRNGTVTIPKLHWTASRDLPVEGRARRYKLSDDLELPDTFRSDLTEILDLLVLVIGAYFTPEKAPTRGPLPDFIKRIHKLLMAEGTQWPPATRQNLTFGFADLCFVHGVQDWKNDEWLQMAQDAYETAIPKDDTVWLFHRYLIAFYNLGMVYQSRGVCLGNRELSEKAADLFRRIAGITAATDYPEDRWIYIASRTELGNALRILGSEDDGTAKLVEAVSAYRMVADVDDPYFRQQILVGLGAALALIGGREPGTVHLKEAIAPYEAAIRDATSDESRNTLTEKLRSIQLQIETRSESATEESA